MSRGATIRAALWAFTATAGTRLVTLVSLAILARLLTPADFGLLAFALVYITYAETVGDLGTTVALIYWPNRREDAAQVTFVINLAMGAFWCILTLALAPAIGAFFDNPEATPIVRVMALSFLIKFFGNTHDGLVQKDLRFRARVISELALVLTKAAIAIALAVAGFGAWSLVWGHLSGLVIWTTSVWMISSWRPRLAFPGDLFRPMLRYGQGIVGVNVIAAIVHHADLVVVGRMLGATALGLYQMAYKIPEATITVVIWVVSKVLFPAFSRIQQSGRDLRSAYLEALRYVAFLTIPMAAGLFLIAGPLVLLVFGPAWAGSIPLLRWLAIYSGVRSLGTHAGDVLKATGRSGLLAVLGLVKGAILIPLLILAGRKGVEPVAMTMAIVTTFTAFLNVFIVKRLLHFRWADVARALSVSSTAGVILIVVALGVQVLLAETEPLVLVTVTVVASAAAYLSAAFLLDRRLVTEVVQAVARRRSTDGGAAS